ncbi:MAG: hypothetical protein OXC79_04255 [Candidatus Poribacteria bacterium]|nr:hypothetical protein [Candidatus Poribacteria bacterium]
MSNNDPITKSDLQTILDHITSERQKVENYIDDELEKTNTKVDALQKGVSGLKKDMSNLENKVDNLENKVDNLTDAVVEGFDNTERTLSDWEEKPVNLISKEKKDKLQKTA